MRIAFLYDCIYPYKIGGVERRVWELGRRLARLGHEVHLFGMQFWEGEKIIEREGVVLHGVCPVRPLYFQGRRTIFPAMVYSLNVCIPLLKEKFDIIDAQQFPYFHCFPAKIAAVIHKNPLVITWHEVWGDYWYDYLGWMGFFGKCIEQCVCSLTKNRIAVSPSTQHHLWGPGFNNRSSIIPNGMDFELIDSISPSLETSDIIFAGRFIREKNVDLLIEAVALLTINLPDIRAVIIGDGPEREILQAMVRNKGLEKNVRFAGFLPEPGELISLMKASRVFVLPSIREGFGMAALEAMACGLPIVTVDHPRNATRDLITTDTGIVTGLSAESLAGAIQECLDKHMSCHESCRSQAKKYDWEFIVDRLERYYHSLTR